MIAASLPEQRAANAKVLAVDRAGRLRHWPRRDVARLFDAGDLVIANDAATIPASLAGQHLPIRTPNRSAPRGTRVAGRRPRDLIHGGAVRSRRLPDAHRGPPAATTSRAGRSPGIRPAAGDGHTPTLRSPASGRHRVRRATGGDLGRPGPTRQADSICARDAAARALGHLDADRRRASCVRAAFSQLRARLADARVDEATTCSFRHDHARGGTIVDGGSGPRRAAAVRRTLRNPGAHHVGTAARARRGPADRGDRHDGRPGTRACRRTRRHRPRRRRASRPNASVRPLTSASSTPFSRALTSRARATMRS